MGWQKLVLLLVNISFVKQNINQVLLILFTKLVNPMNLFREFTSNHLFTNDYVKVSDQDDKKLSALK